MSVSSRQLRRIRKDENHFMHEKEIDSDDDDVPFSSISRTTQQTNRYNLLNNGSEPESDVQEDDGEADQSADNAPNHDVIGLRRKKKKRKRKPVPQNKRPSSEDLDEVERSVREVNALLGDTTPGPSLVKTLPIINLESLTIDKRHLNATNELRRIFGPEALQTSKQPSRGRKRGCQKNLLLVQDRGHWNSQNKTGATLSMSIVKSENGLNYFKYVHSLNYQAVEKKFLGCVNSFEPMQLMMITQSHPFHINTLLQLSEICDTHEEYQSAAHILERAIYGLEKAFHPQFNLTKGNCRLEYKYQENRAFFIALFRHLVLVGQRACYRTALELCKVLLSLSPDRDPLAIALAIDFYAIRSGEYQWLLEFVEEGDAARNLTLLPNLSFGCALAHFYLGNLEKRDKALRESLLMFPGMLLPLLEACSISPDDRVRNSQFFNDGKKNLPPSLECCIKLYVARSFHLWKDPVLLPWIEYNANHVLDLVSEDIRGRLLFREMIAKRYSCKIPRPILRHVYLSKFPDVPLRGRTPTYHFDPFPPLHSIGIYEPPPPHQRSRISGVSNFALFFQSMAPSFTPEGAARRRNEGVAEEVENANHRATARAIDLERSISTLLDAMRDLMSNLTSRLGEEDDTEGLGLTENEENQNR